MTIDEFKQDAERSRFRMLDIVSEGRQTQDEIPYSECAMHCRIAGKKPIAVAVSADNRGAFVLTDSGVFCDALVSEIVPWAMRRHYALG